MRKVNTPRQLLSNQVASRIFGLTMWRQVQVRQIWTHQ